jgi:hypothetical protein
LGALIGSLRLPSILLFPCVQKFVKIFPTKVFLSNNLVKAEINVLDFELKRVQFLYETPSFEGFSTFHFFYAWSLEEKRT